MAGDDILELLRRDRLVSAHAVLITPLGGGVSSDVFLVEQEAKRFVVKRALPRLKVKDNWQADTGRNRVEYEFLHYLRGIIPDCVPGVLAVCDGYFAMEYLGPEYKNWKEVLLAGDCRVAVAAQAARLLGMLHRISYGNAELARRFDTTPNFHQLRTDPYLLTTGRRHPALQKMFEAEALRLEQTRECLVHGDFSPKNILIGNGRFVLLDCEVAWYGDPAFDLAFLINHLLLKSLYRAPIDHGFEKLIEEFISTYFSERELHGSAGAVFSSRTAKLLLMLLLARIDGKSPVEYVNGEDKRNFVRAFVSDRLARPGMDLNRLVVDWFRGLQTEVWRS